MSTLGFSSIRGLPFYQHMPNETGPIERVHLHVLDAFLTDVYRVEKLPGA